MPPGPLRLALIQMRVTPGDPPANVRRAAELVARAAREGARMALLPEAFTTGWTDERGARFADAIPGGATCRSLQGMAAEQGIFLAAGWIERAPEGCCYNAAALIAPDGRVLLHHRKIYELEIAHGCYALGNRLAVAETPFGRVGLMICADAFAPGQVISRTLALMGADLILSPCAWAVPADHDQAREPYGRLWQDNYGPVARDFRLWIAGASNVGPIETGPWAGRRCIGCSLLVGPEGEPVVQGPYGVDAEAVLLADLRLEPRPARGDAWERFWAGAPASPARDSVPAAVHRPTAR